VHFPMRKSHAFIQPRPPGTADLEPLQAIGHRQNVVVEDANHCNRWIVSSGFCS
jgi:hypothetical protein